MLKEFLGIPVDDWYEIKRVIELHFMGDMELFCDFFENPDLTIKDLKLEIRILRQKIKRAEKVLS